MSLYSILAEAMQKLLDEMEAEAERIRKKMEDRKLSGGADRHSSRHVEMPSYPNVKASQRARVECVNEMAIRVSNG